MYHIDNTPQNASWTNLEDPLRKVANAKNLVCMYAGESFLSQSKGIDPAASERAGQVAKYDMIAEAYRNVAEYQEDLNVVKATATPIAAGSLLLEVDLEEADADV